MRIMVCVDDSAASEAVLSPSVAFADAAGASVELVRVLRPETIKGVPRGEAPPPASSATWRSPGASNFGARMDQYEGRQVVERERLVEQTEATMLGELRTLAARFASPAECSVLASDDVAEALVEHARMSGADLVAMATHARGAVGQAVRGSVTQAVIRSGVAPVLVTYRED
jgi:nucleotide-binding universal stress UspA family protein